MARVTFDLIFTTFPRTEPTDTLPSIKTDLKNIPLTQNVLVWFGHSSYFIQLNGKRFLIDPVFSGRASPIPGSAKSFKGTDVYSTDDMPDIDVLLLSHDHYDHLDYRTIKKLTPKIKHIICGLGLGEHLEHWDVDPSNIIEKDWNETIIIADDVTLHTTPARHFSGRGFQKNNTLWLSFVLETPDFKIFLGGDSGYDNHFADIGETFGGFDLAILENGQYNEAWHEVHMMPEEVLTAAQDLKAKRIMPIHLSKFKLGFHPWDEPMTKLTELNQSVNIPLLTPIIGELVNLDDLDRPFKEWWRGLD